MLLIDERPEEVTEMARTVRGEVVSAPSTSRASRHVQVAEMVIEKAKRLTEHKLRRCHSAGLDHPSGARLQHGRAVVRQGTDRRCRRERAAPAQAVFRRGAQYRRGRQPDHHRHGAGRYRLAHGRRHLRGVQGHRQHGSPPGPPHRGETRFPGDQHQPLGHTQGRAADAARKSCRKSGCCASCCTRWTRSRPSSSCSASSRIPRPTTSSSIR